MTDETPPTLCPECGAILTQWHAWCNICSMAEPMGPRPMDDRLRDYILTLPEVVQEVAFRVPPDTCYRDEAARSHYRIHAYDEPADGPIRVTLRVIHGADSFLPGMTVFGKHPDSLIPCGCGKWEPMGPRPEETEG